MLISFWGFDLIVRVEKGDGVDDYMDLHDARVQRIMKIMKIKEWYFIRYIPNKDEIHHQYCILPISDIPDGTSKAERIGAYMFNFSFVEEKSVLESVEFKAFADKLKRVPEPLRGFVGPLPQDEVMYRLLKINDELAPLPPKSGNWV